MRTYKVVMEVTKSLVTEVDAHTKDEALELGRMECAATGEIVEHCGVATEVKSDYMVDYDYDRMMQEEADNRAA